MNIEDIPRLRAQAKICRERVKHCRAQAASCKARSDFVGKLKADDSARQNLREAQALEAEIKRLKAA